MIACGDLSFSHPLLPSARKRVCNQVMGYSNVCRREVDATMCMLHEDRCDEEKTGQGE